MTPLDVPYPMRYLVVPSEETQLWKDFLNSNDWLEKGFLIEKEGEKRAIPLSINFPNKIPNLLKDFTVINKEIINKKINDYLGYLKEIIGDKIYNDFFDFWPQSYDQMGEIIIIKIHNEIHDYSKEIGSALLLHNKKITRIYQDLGVKGQFRVRNLRLIGGPVSLGGETKIRENGVEFTVDPTKGYYSPRLANERLETLESAVSLKSKLGRKLNICDAYAGFGPALMPLLVNNNLVEFILANDLNVNIIEILERNLIGNNKHNCTIKIECENAKNLLKYPNYKGLFDLLLVNLPHSTLEHLPSLIGLLRKESTAVLRAWCIIDNEKIEDIKNQIIEIFYSQGYLISKIDINSTRSYSPTQNYVKIEVWSN